jgi:hypothetical protein
MDKHLLFLIVVLVSLFTLVLSSGPVAYAKPHQKEIPARRAKVDAVWHDLIDRGYRQDTGQVDYQNYDIDINLDPANHFLSGYANIVLRSRVNQLNDVYFIIYNDSLEIESVTNGADTLAFSYDSLSWVLEVNLNNTLGVGQEDTIRIDYSGYITPALSESTYYFCRLDSVIGYCTYFPYVWYPMPYDQNSVHRWTRWASGNVSLTVPQGWAAVSNGALLDTSATGSTRTYNWGTDKTVVEFVFAAAPYRKAVQQHAGIEFSYYDFDTTYAQSFLSTASSIYDFYTNIFCTYSFDKLAFAEMLQSNIGYGAYTVVAAEMPTPLALLGHEIAHQWWAHIVSQSHTDEDWISESFADYSMHLFKEDSMGWSAMMAGLQTFANYYLTVPPSQDVSVIPSPYNSIYYGAIIYGKGVWTLHMLRGVLGDAIFFDIMQTFANVYTDSSATAEMFEGVAEQVSGQSLDWYFDEWLYRAGYPKYVTYKYYKTHPDSNSAIIRVHQSASIGNLFKMPVSLACSTSIGTRDTVVWDSLEWHHYMLVDTLPIVAVVFDPRIQILRVYNDSLPRLQSILPGNQELTIIWKQYHDNPLPAGYNVYRSLNPGGTFQRINQHPIPDTTYIDTGLMNGTPYYYRVTAVNSVDTCYETRFSNMMSSMPQGIVAGSDRPLFVDDYELGQNQPNPFRTSSALQYSLSNGGKTSLIIYDASGRLVRTLVDEYQNSNVYSATWNGRDDQEKRVAPGVYFCVLNSNNMQLTKKMILLE